MSWPGLLVALASARSVGVAEPWRMGYRVRDFVAVEYASTLMQRAERMLGFSFLGDARAAVVDSRSTTCNRPACLGVWVCFLTFIKVCCSYVWKHPIAATLVLVGSIRVCMFLMNSRSRLFFSGAHVVSLAWSMMELIFIQPTIGITGQGVSRFPVDSQQ